MSWRTTLSVCLIPAVYALVVYLALLAHIPHFVWIHLASSVLVRVWISVMLVRRDVGGAAGVHSFAWGVCGRIAGDLTLALLASPAMVAPSILGGTDEIPFPDIFVGVVGWDHSYFSFISSDEIVGGVVFITIGLLCSGAWQYGFTMVVEWNRDRKLESRNSTHHRLR